MMATHTNKDSAHIMHLIKKNTIGAEIGVWFGNTSTQFLKKELKKFYMVDPYSVDPYEYLGKDYMQQFYTKYSKITGEFSKEGFMRYYNGIHKEVCQKVKQYPAAQVCRMTSDEWFAEHKDIELDWIYIDGDHSYEATLKDLNNAFAIVKKGGMILGDDYNLKPGTTKAVNEFKEKNNLKIFRYGKTQFCIKT